MFDNVPSAPSAAGSRRPDRRVTRTRDRLGDALIALLLTKPFDEITVQDVLTHARVSRSTFYAHYRDKDDLLLSDVDDFFGMMSGWLERQGEKSMRVAPVAELFAHVAESRELIAALTESGRMADVRELGEAHFARGIEARLERVKPTAAMRNTERAARAHALAGALMALVFWGLRQGRAITPAVLDGMFHTTVWGADYKGDVKTHGQVHAPWQTPPPKGSVPS